MSSSDFTFKQAEKLLEELKIITPTLEDLLKRAQEMKDTNKEASTLNGELAANLRAFDTTIKQSINGELDKRLKSLERFDELENSINRNIAYLKKAAEKTTTLKSINCFLLMVAVAAAVFYAAKYL
jgi:hypothetical protein